VGTFTHLFPVPIAFMVYFSPTQVTLVSNPEVNPTWYPMEKANAKARNTIAKVPKKSTKLPKILQNFSMAPPLLVPGYFTLLLPCVL
jgi:hypothetical protein